MRQKNIYSPAVDLQDSIWDVMDLHVYNLFSVLQLSVSIMVLKVDFFPRADNVCLLHQHIMICKSLLLLVSEPLILFAR